MKRALSVLLMPAVILASVPTRAQAAGSDWSRVTAVKAGTQLFVTLACDKTSRPVYFVSASEDTLVVLDPNTIPASAMRFMLGVLDRHPEYLVKNRGEFLEDGFRLAPEGLFYRDTEIAERTDVVKTLQKTNIIEIIRPAKGASGTAVAGAVAGGIAGGLLLGMGALFSPCHGSCTGNVFTFFLMAAGVPIAAGFLTAQGTRRGPETLYHG